jgi:RNA polymerase alpha subunit
MPTRSTGDVPAGTIRDLGLPGRAVTALTRAGVTSTRDLALLTRRELAAIPGLGPGTIAAIRLVVPEPPTGAGRSAGRSAAGPEDLGVTATGPEDEGWPAAPAIPSLESLRDPRRRTAVDLLVPGAAPAAATGPAPAAAAAGTAPAPGPRPAEYTDLLRLGVRAVRAAASLPGRLALWSVRAPVGCLRRLFRDPSGSRSAAGEARRRG